MEETKEQQQIYTIFRSCIYIILIFEIVVNLPIPAHDPIIRFLLTFLYKLKVFNSVPGCKLMELVCIAITCIGTKARKEMKFNMKTMVIYPLAIGFYLVLTSIFVHKDAWGGTLLGLPTNRAIYAFCSVIGIMLIHQGLDAISKYFNHKLGEDRFNFENESFQQMEEKVENDFSVNIPMIYYFNKRMRKGWVNIINPFRATLVLGTPGSGKSFGIIEPFIRQHSAKGFTMMVYDYKFPTLSKNLLYQYCKNKKYGHLPENCGFHIINFANVRYSNRINPIQRKYITDLAAASETAATLLESLNKGGGDKRGGSEAFFKNASENFLAAIIYFFVNFHPTGFCKGKKLKRYFHYTRTPRYGDMKEGTLQLAYKQWKDYAGVDKAGNIILDFYNEEWVNMSLDKDGMFVDLEGFSYLDSDGSLVNITETWYEDQQGNKVKPDTITGEYSSMAHVLQFLNKPYKEVFTILMSDPAIKPLMAPFESAYQNKAMDQLEGMVGTLRVSAGRLATQEAYWVFTGDDFDLKISDKNHPTYLVIANDPEKEQVIGSLNALILNRLVMKINSRGNYPCSLIVDELPTLYFHKIDRLIGTARSNKVSVTLGFQELPQLEADYGKNGMQKILSTCGNIFMGAARNKETLEWAQNDVFGKVKQTSKSISINDQKVSTSISEHMDYLLPAAKIADMATGWLAGQVARDFTQTDDSSMQSFEIEKSTEFKTSKYFCKTNFNMKKIKDEEGCYEEIPVIYHFGSDRDMEIILRRNFNQIETDIQKMIHELLPEGKVVQASI